MFALEDEMYINEMYINEMFANKKITFLINKQSTFKQIVDFIIFHNTCFGKLKD